MAGPTRGKGKAGKPPRSLKPIGGIIEEERRDREPSRDTRVRDKSRPERHTAPGKTDARHPPQGRHGGAKPSGRQDAGRPRGHKGGRKPAPFEPIAETMEPAPLPALAKEGRPMRVLRELQTDPRFGKRPQERTVEELLRFGVVVLDKPQGPTSHQVVAWLREVLGVKKVGHGGTLDPKVTGVLPTTIGDATKAVKTMLTAGKEYVAVMRLHGDADEETVRTAARKFIGKVRQVPPVRSAVARRLRARRIYDLEVLDIEGRDVLFRVACEAGTYIRNLCVDLGKMIGTRGHMAELRRTRTGLLDESMAVSLYDVKDAFHFWKEEGDDSELKRIVHPFELVVGHLPRIVIGDGAVDAVCHGANLAAPGLAAVEEGIEAKMAVALFSAKGEAVALARATMDTERMASAASGIVAELERVLMPAGTYPSGWKNRAHREAVLKEARDLGIF